MAKDKAEKKDLQTQAEETGLVVSPAEMKAKILAVFEQGREGFEEGMNPKEAVIPRVRLLQGLSPEVQEKPRDFFAGMVINSLTKETLPPRFIPILKWTNWVRFNPRSDKDANFVPGIKAGEVVWRSTDPDDPRVVNETKFGKNGETPAATTFMNFLCYFEGIAMPLVLSFGKTSYGAGKELLNIARYAGGAMRSGKYELGVRQETNEKGTYYVYTVAKVGTVEADELEIGKTLYDAFAPYVKELKVHEEGGSEA
jgi:hypothetical protein